jgi:Glutamine amidotransferases class-II
MQVPHKFMQKVAKAEGIELPAAGEYGVGAVYGSPDPATRLPTVGYANESTTIEQTQENRAIISTGYEDAPQWRSITSGTLCERASNTVIAGFRGSNQPTGRNPANFQICAKSEIKPSQRIDIYVTGNFLDC